MAVEVTRSRPGRQAISAERIDREIKWRTWFPKDMVLKEKGAWRDIV